jgi:chromosome partitioning protein
MPILASSLAQRVAYGESMGSGQTVFDMDPDGPASVEVAALAKEILEIADAKEASHRPAAGGHTGR